MEASEAAGSGSTALHASQRTQHLVAASTQHLVAARRSSPHGADGAGTRNGKQALSARGFKRVGRHSELCYINGMEVRKKRPSGFKKRDRGFK